ncbi:MAG: nucleotidyltransferase family protein [Bacteroidota bacterium]|nr:nucleotidyltransferase family protein [Bacteroidota bacterium]
MQEIEKYKQLILPVLKRYAIKRAAVFGSAAKGLMTPESDVDLLVESSDGFTLFKLLRLEEEISELTKRKVDIVEYAAIKSSMKDEVLLSSISIL